MKRHSIASFKVRNPPSGRPERKSISTEGVRDKPQEEHGIALNRIDVSFDNQKDAKSKKNVEKQKVQANDIEIDLFLQNILTTNGYILTHKQKDDLPSPLKHYELALVFPYSNDRFDISQNKSQFSMNILNVEGKESKSSNPEYLRRKFEQLMLGINDPKSQSTEELLRDEEEKLAKDPAHDRTVYKDLLHTLNKRFKRDETASFFKSKACMEVSPFFDGSSTTKHYKDLTREDMKDLLQNKLRLRLLCAYRFLKLLHQVKAKRKSENVDADKPLEKSITSEYQQQIEKTRKHIATVFSKHAPDYNLLSPSLVKELVACCRNKFRLKDKVGNGQEQHALYLESLWNSGKEQYKYFLVSQLKKIKDAYAQDERTQQSSKLAVSKRLKREETFEDDIYTVLRKSLDHNLSVLFLLLAVGFTLILVFLEFAYDVEREAQWIPAANLICSVLFTIEVAIRMVAMGIWNKNYKIACSEIIKCFELPEERNESNEHPGYFQDMFCWTDFLVTILDWISFVVTRVLIKDSSTQNAASLIVAFRFVRILRILRMAGGIKKAKQLASIAKKLPFVKDIEYKAMEMFGQEYVSFVTQSKRMQTNHVLGEEGEDKAIKSLKQVREFNLCVAYTVATRLYKVCGLNVRVKLLPSDNFIKSNGEINAKSARIVVFVGANTSRLKTLAGSLNYRIQTMNRPLISSANYNTKKTLSERFPHIDLRLDNDLTTSPIIDTHLWKKRSHIELFNILSAWGHRVGEHDDVCVGENETYFAPYIPYDPDGPLQPVFRHHWNDNCYTNDPRDRKTFGSSDRITMIVQEMKRHLNLEYIMGKILVDYLILGDKWVHKFSNQTKLQKIAENLGQRTRAMSNITENAVNRFSSKESRSAKMKRQKSSDDLEDGKVDNDYTYIERQLHNVHDHNIVLLFQYLSKKEYLTASNDTPEFQKSNVNMKRVALRKWFISEPDSAKKNAAFDHLALLMSKEKLGNWAKHSTLQDIALDVLVACIPSNWLMSSNLLCLQQLDLSRLQMPALELKWYFGTDVTYYFLWLAKYIHRVQFPALTGFIVFILHLATDAGRANEVSNRANVVCAGSSTVDVSPLLNRSSVNSTLLQFSATPADLSNEYAVSTSIFFTSTLIYCAVLYLWSIDFASTWEAYEKRIALLFGYTESGHKDDKSDPNYNFQGVTTRNVVTDDLEKDYEDKLIWKCNLWFSRTTMFMLLVVVLASVVALIIFKIFMAKVSPTYGAGIVGLLQGIVIVILDYLWKGVAKYLTEIENHRYIEDYQKSIIRKTFLFSFINSYISIAYIAFFKAIVDPCSCIPKLDCVGEAHTQLITIFISRLVVQNSIEHVHKLAACFNTCCCVKSEEHVHTAEEEVDQNTGEGRQETLCVAMHSSNSIRLDLDRQTMSELSRAPYEFKEHFDNFNEIVINHGYWLLFGAIFPIGSLATLILNTVELRLDAYSMWTDFRRPDPMPEDQILVWKELLNLVSFIAIISNCVLVIYTADTETLRNVESTVKLVFLLGVCTTLGTIFVSSRLTYVSTDLRHALNLLKRFQHFGNKIQGKLFVDENSETFGTQVRETEAETLRRRKRRASLT